MGNYKNVYHYYNKNSKELPSNTKNKFDIKHNNNNNLFINKNLNINKLNNKISDNSNFNNKTIERSNISSNNNKINNNNNNNYNYTYNIKNFPLYNNKNTNFLNLSKTEINNYNYNNHSKNFNHFNNKNFYCNYNNTLAYNNNNLNKLVVGDNFYNSYYNQNNNIANINSLNQIVFNNFNTLNNNVNIYNNSCKISLNKAYNNTNTYYSNSINSNNYNSENILNNNYLNSSYINNNLNNKNYFKNKALNINNGNYLIQNNCNLNNNNFKKHNFNNNNYKSIKDIITKVPDIYNFLKKDNNIILCTTLINNIKNEEVISFYFKIETLIISNFEEIFLTNKGSNLLIKLVTQLKKHIRDKIWKILKTFNLVFIIENENGNKIINKLINYALDQSEQNLIIKSLKKIFNNLIHIKNGNILLQKILTQFYFKSLFILTQYISKNIVNISSSINGFLIIKKLFKCIDNPKYPETTIKNDSFEPKQEIINLIIDNIANNIILIFQHKLSLAVLLLAISNLKIERIKKIIYSFFKNIFLIVNKKYSSYIFVKLLKLASLNVYIIYLFNKLYL